MVNLDNLLVHERQLSGQLNAAVQQTRRSEFGLLLSLLSEEVACMSQANESRPELRANYQSHQLKNDIYHSHGLTGQRLQDALCPPPLVYDSEPPVSMKRALNNCAPIKSLENRLASNQQQVGSELLNQLQQSQVLANHMALA
ncbi:VC2046/SO_2500 family protein [Paraferrimonas sedimenticola]|uniref:Uncharacterized protein n=1 Tax=Paraferrimonas sedimenticola TaxID=375674 RepID=A0AA37RZ71_9GAMM|nr:VC2046/SO_2500 family protein [Paraferrimonas sedimenticola]GLP97876.1 hypothetical protein GCM10007895_31830 [Paraferrimonas sedimenticola]